jgi:hypothetical protein
MAILTTICQLVACVKRVTMSGKVGNVRVLSRRLHRDTEEK